MKFLWAVIALLLITSGYLALRPSAPAAAPVPAAGQPTSGTPSAIPGVGANSVQVPPSVLTPPVRPDRPAPAVADRETPASTTPVNVLPIDPPAPASAPAPPPATLAKPAPATDPLEELAAQALSMVAPGARPGEVTTDAAPAKPADAPATPAAPSAEKPAASPGSEVLPKHADFPPDKMIPAKSVEKSDQGALRLDGRFVVKGAGTAESPFTPSWDLLISAEEVYKPRSGMKKMPERVTFLHDQRVRITGFVAFPITSNNPKECLVMLNQWDGCCIGVPPTAFDAIEVKLRKAATDAQRLAVHGVIEGKLRVDPYEDGGWVLGLYLMDDATFTPD